MRTTNRKSPIVAFASVLALLLASASAVAGSLADGIGGWVPAERLTGHHVLLERLEQGQTDTPRGALILWTQDGRRIPADAVVSVKEKRGAFAVCNLIVEQWHAYCVGNQRIVIHNGNPCAAPRKLTQPLRNKMKRISNATAAGGNRGISGAVSGDEAMELGRAFVGPDARLMSNGRGYVSADGLRQFRFPSAKKGIDPLTGNPFSRTGVQANFQSRASSGGTWTSNVHLDVE